MYCNLRLCTTVHYVSARHSGLIYSNALRMAAEDEVLPCIRKSQTRRHVRSLIKPQNAADRAVSNRQLAANTPKRLTGAEIL